MKGGSWGAPWTRDHPQEELEDFKNNYRKYEAETKKNLAGLEKGRDDARKILEELKVLHSIEEISDDDFEEKSATQTQRIKQNEKDIKDAQSQLKELNKIRRKLPKLATVEKTKKRKIRNEKKIKEKLATLDLAYKDGKIGKELYEKLKAKYEEEVKKLHDSIWESMANTTVLETEATE